MERLPVVVLKVVGIYDADYKNTYNLQDVKDDEPNFNHYLIHIGKKRVMFATSNDQAIGGDSVHLVVDKENNAEKENGQGGPLFDYFKISLPRPGITQVAIEVSQKGIMVSYS